MPLANFNKLSKKFNVNPDCLWKQILTLFCVCGAYLDGVAVIVSSIIVLAQC